MPCKSVNLPTTFSTGFETIPESDSIAIPEVIPRVIPGVIPHRMQGRIPVAIADRFPTGGCFAPVVPLSGTPSAKLNRGGNCTHSL
jgi:hypothetical protein